MAGGMEVLKERGFVQQCSDEKGLQELMQKQSVSFYAGFDPTASSLHVGHLVPLFAMSHLQQAGHQPIALVGGGTARIGDPSGKTETRKMQSVETIKANAELFKGQISRFIDFGPGKATMVDNADWLAGLNYIDFLRDIGQHFSVNRMLTFETYKMRLETGLSFIEFNYQILQSYDYLILFKKYGCRLQIGGDDQWGNIVSGMDLIRRIESADTFALTSPLVTRADGKKMGKTEKGALFLDPQLTSVYDFYQYWVNIADQDVRKFLLLYTYLPVAEINRLAALKDKEINEAKKVLAYELTKIVHGAAAADNARDAARALFDKNAAGEAADIPSTAFKVPAGGMPLVDFIALSGLVTSKSEARRLIQQGGAYINDVNYTDVNASLDAALLSAGPLMLRAGKKRYWRMLPE